VSPQSPAPGRAIGRALARWSDAQRDCLVSTVALDHKLDTVSYRGEADLVAELSRAADRRTICGHYQVALADAGLLSRRFWNHFGDHRPLAALGVERRRQFGCFRSVTATSWRSTTSWWPSAIRSGFGQTIFYYRQAINDPESAVKNPTLRKYVGEVLEQVLDLVFKDAQLYNRFRTLLQKQDRTRGEDELPESEDDDVHEIARFDRWKLGRPLD
jgi:hypothetical protein